MTLKEKETFEKNFGFPVPPSLEALLDVQSLRDALPVRFVFPNERFVYELRKLLSLEDERNYDTEKKQLAFALCTDGHRQIIDLSDESLRLMQDEFGDIDYLGITIQDLLDASRVSI
jgi:hypothetical protein